MHLAMNSLRNYLNPPIEFVRDRTLRGHIGSIHSLAVDKTGLLLASGGDDGVRVWDLQRRVPVQTPPNHGNVQRGQITCIKWIPCPDDADKEALCIGTALGYLIIWTTGKPKYAFRQTFLEQLASGFEILSLASACYGVDEVRLAVGMADTTVQVWSCTSDDMQALFSIKVMRNVPKALHFINGGKELLVCGLWNGQILKVQAHDGVAVQIRDVHGLIGNAAFDREGAHFVLDNATDGYDLYRLTTAEFIRKFHSGAPEPALPRQVAFALNGQAVVGGGNDGNVFVFDRESGSIVQTLPHVGCGLMQTVTAHDYPDGGGSLLVTAAFATKGGSLITIWKRPARQAVKAEQPVGAMKMLLLMVVAVCTIRGALGFVGTDVTSLLHSGADSLTKAKLPGWLQDARRQVASTSSRGGDMRPSHTWIHASPRSVADGKFRPVHRYAPSQDSPVDSQQAHGGRDRVLIRSMTPAEPAVVDVGTLTEDMDAED